MMLIICYYIGQVDRQFKTFDYSNLEVILELVEEMRLIPAVSFLRISSLDSAV